MVCDVILEREVGSQAFVLKCDEGVGGGGFNFKPQSCDIIYRQPLNP